MFTSLIINILLATSAFAVPRAKLGSTLAERVAARATRGNISPVPASTSTFPVEFSTNWAGAVIKSPPTGKKFQFVSGVVTVPTPSRPTGLTSGKFTASAFIGIDGYTFHSASLQAGIDFAILDNDTISCDAWFKWSPNTATITGMSISPGDTIGMTIMTNSNTSGTVILDNFNTGAVVIANVSAPSPSTALGGQNVELVVADSGSTANFANFTPFAFTIVLVNTNSASLDLSTATIVEIVNNSQIQTNVSIPNSFTSVQIVRI